MINKFSSAIDGRSHWIKTHVLSDNSGYYIIGRNSGTNIATICKFTFSSPSSSQWQQIGTISNYEPGQLMLSDTKFFFFGVDSSSPYSLHLWTANFGGTSVNWANIMSCPSGTWDIYDAESLINSNKSKIYSFFTFGSTYYLYFASFSTSNGNVIDSRYKSSINWNGVIGSALQTNYIIVTIECSSAYYLMINLLHIIETIISIIL